MWWALCPARTLVCAAYAEPSPVHLEVGAREGMALDAPGLAGVVRSGPNPSQNVGPARYGIQVPRVAAQRIAAQVVEVESCGNGGYEVLVGDAVCGDHSTLASAGADDAVTLGRCTGPLPAALCVHGAAGEKPIDGRACRAGQSATPHGGEDVCPLVQVGKACRTLNSRGGGAQNKRPRSQ